jgi:hypothetical protein
MTRSLRYFALAAALACSLSFSQFAHAAFLHFGTKAVDLTNNPNDCLTLGLAALNRFAFANIRRGANFAAGVRQKVKVFITCVPSPESPQFVVVVMAGGDNDQTTRSVKDLVVSNM